MRVISLNGQWDFIADLDPKYHAVHGGFHQPEINRRHWRKAPVPEFGVNVYGRKQSAAIGSTIRVQA